MNRLFVLCVVLAWTIPSAWGQFGWGMQASAMPEFNGQPSITVTGEATVHVVPDKIIVRLGVETRDKNLQGVKSRHDEGVRDVLAALRGLGVPESSIQAAHVSMRPGYENWHPSLRPDQYYARTMILVTVNDVSLAEELVTVALEEGATHIHGIDYQTSELKKHREHARELAILAAREKAEKLSAALGNTVGNALVVKEDPSRTLQPYWAHWYGWYHGGGHGGGSQVQVQAATSQPEPMGDTVAFGRIGVGASVSVMFALED